MTDELTWEDIVKKEFSAPARGEAGYDEAAVDDFLDQVVSAVHAGTLTAGFVQGQTFPKPRGLGRRGYSAAEVDEFLGKIAAQFGGAARFTGDTAAAQQSSPSGGGTASWGSESSVSGESPYVERKNFLSRIFGKG